MTEIQKTEVCCTKNSISVQGVIEGLSEKGRALYSSISNSKAQAFDVLFELGEPVGDIFLIFSVVQPGRRSSLQFVRLVFRQKASCENVCAPAPTQVIWNFVEIKPDDIQI